MIFKKNVFAQGVSKNSLHLDEVHKSVHYPLPVAGPAVLEVDERGVDVVPPGPERHAWCSVPVDISGLEGVYCSKIEREETAPYDGQCQDKTALQVQNANDQL